MIKKKT